MPSYSADELLAQLMEETQNNGGDVEKVRRAFIAQNTNNGFFNPNQRIELDSSLGLTVKQLAKTLSSLSGPAATAKTGNKQSTTTTSYDPASFDAVLDLGKRNKEAGAALSKEVVDLADQFNTDVTKGTAALEQAGSAKSQAILAKGDQQAGMNDFNANLLRSLGLDATDPNSRISKLNAGAAQAEQAMSSLQPQLTALNSVNFMDNPLAWVKAQFQLEGIAQQYNSQAQVYNDNVKQATAIQELGNRQLNAQKGINTDLIRTEALAEAKAAQAEQAIKVVSLENQSRGARMAAISTLLSINGNEFTSAYQLLKLTADKNTYTDEQGKVDLDKQDMALVNKRQRMLGLAEYTEARWKDLSKAEKSKAVQESSRTTEDIADSAGRSLAKLWEKDAFLSFQQDMPEQGKKFLNGYHAQAMARVDTLQRDPKNAKLKPEELYIKAADELMKGWTDELERRDYSSLDSNGPFAMNAQVFAQSEKLKNNPYTKYVLSSTEGGAGLSVKNLLEHHLARLKTTNQPGNVAEELSQFFREGYATQLQTYRLQVLGVSAQNPKTRKYEFPVKFDQFTLFERFVNPGLRNDSRSFDLLDPVAVNHWTVINGAQAIAREQSINAAPLLTR